eukprot:914602-Pyramimonas_sp.AAC.1
MMTMMMMMMTTTTTMMMMMTTTETERGSPGGTRSREGNRQAGLDGHGEPRILDELTMASHRRCLADSTRRRKRRRRRRRSRRTRRRSRRRRMQSQPRILTVPLRLPVFAR